jgi:TetR/AcrR family transcriptional regulator, regulator of cefoperazone and chloramphenicol sensitivity
MQPPKRKRDREASTQALLEAAVAVFSEQGYDAATTKEVAKRAGVSEALIHRYFESKAGLLVAILEDFSKNEVECGLANLPYRDTLQEEFLQLISVACDNHRALGSFIRVALSRAIIDPKIGQQLRTSVHDKRLPALIARLKHYQQVKKLSEDADLEAIAFGVSSLSFSLGFMAPQIFQFDKDRIDRIAVNMAEILGQGAAAAKRAK